jgi:MscS family membrane protein
MKTLNASMLLVVLMLLQPLDAQTSKPEPSVDPLGRGTPQGTVVGLIDAVKSDNLERAAEYLDSTLEPRTRQELARELGIVLDRKLITSPGSFLTNDDRGDGRSSNRARVGVVETAAGNIEVALVRVVRDSSPAIWLFSSDLLEKISGAYAEVQPLPLEGYVPVPLRTTRWLSIPLYRWIVIALFIPLIFLVAALSTRLLTALLGPLLRRITWEHDSHNLKAIVAPLRLQMLAVFFYAVSFLGVSFGARRAWAHLAETLTVIALCWLTLMLMDVVATLTLKRSQRLNRPGDTALVRLLNRLSKAAALIIAGLVLLYLGGVDLTAVLTGLGVGGIAIGFGAQKTIENLFGGIMVISDRPVNVGDQCRIGEFTGTVEDIGLRSTRIRTADRTVVSIPNGHLANMSLENFAERDRIRFHQTVGLHCQTTADQLRAVLTGIRRLLAAHPKIEAASAGTRFVRFSGASLDVEITAYVLERDQGAFMAVQEELLLGILDVIDASGSSVASPARAAGVADVAISLPTRTARP